MKQKIFTVQQNAIEYVTKMKGHERGTKYVMRRSDSDSWCSLSRNEKVISAIDSGDDLEIKILTNDYDTQPDVLKLDYMQAFELYTFLDMWHRTDPRFDTPKHFDKNKSE